MLFRAPGAKRMNQEQPQLRSGVPDEVKRKRTRPGESATPVELKKLADEYIEAARLLHDHNHRRGPLAWAPYRLSAIHAIELHLNALLLHAGHSPSSVRGLHHNLSARTEMATTAGLKLRKRTMAHLHAINANREYLVSRYSPEPVGTSEINRLLATLNEVASKVSRIIDA